jgi:hypothetical protein
MAMILAPTSWTTARTALPKLEFAEQQEAYIIKGPKNTALDDTTSLVLVIGEPRLELVYVWKTYSLVG